MAGDYSPRRIGGEAIATHGGRSIACDAVFYHTTAAFADSSLAEEGAARANVAPALVPITLMNLIIIDTQVPVITTSPCITQLHFASRGTPLHGQ